MDWLEQISSFFALHLAQTAEQFAKADPLIFALIFAILFVFSLASRSWLIVLASTSLGAIGYVLAVAPNASVTLLTVGGWLGSVLLSLNAAKSRRRERNRQREFERLSETVGNLEAASERRFLHSLNLRTREAADPQEYDAPQ